ncbi:MAG: hypothetical protein IJW09_00375 [Clostridia bacterium]|nr:hypothetical protein [Clostridia bacterium]
MKEFEAHHAKGYAWIFLILAIALLVGCILFLTFWTDDAFLIPVILFPIVAAAMIIMFVITIKKDGLAVAVADDRLILYKKEPIVIPLIDILTVSIHDGDGSFDISIKTATERYSMHCFIKQQRQKKNELITLLRSRGITVRTFDLT